MELALSEAKARLSELVAAAQNGERVVITKRGEPAVELVRCLPRKRGGIDFKKLEATKRRLGIKSLPPEEVKALIADTHNPAFSRQVLGLDEDD